MTHGRAIGIDLGTSNSVVAVVDADGVPRVLTTEEGSTTLPSIVWYAPDGVVIGEAAREGLDCAPDVTIFAAKRLLGRRFDHPEIRRLARALPYELVESPNGDCWIKLAPGKNVSPEEVVALILRELKQIGERFFKEAVTGAVITIPAWYDAAQRQATKDAAQIAGLEVLRLISEPTAAALGYGAHRGADRKYLVCDLGGGTFDVAIVDVESGVFEVLATTGDPFLGGDDVDRAVLEHLVRDVKQVKALDVSTDPIAVERLRIGAQRAKHELSTAMGTNIQINELVQLPSGKATEYSRAIRRDELELWSSPLVRRLEPPILAAFALAGRRPQDVQEVLLVGGMTRMPAIKREIARITGREPKLVPNPEEVVAVGAALEVARLEGAIEGILLIDVAARGISISIEGGDCEPVIAQSAVVPTREHRVFATRHHNEPRIEFDVWEGDAADASKNRHLGKYAVVDLPEAPAGDVLVTVDITLETDGTLRLGATELVSGDRLQVEEVERTGLSRSEVARITRQFAEAS